MNSTQIFNLTEAIAGSPKKTDKERLLKEHACEELKVVLMWTYDPTHNYYIKKIPTVTVGAGNFNFDTYNMLDTISNRLVTGNKALDLLADEMSQLNLESQELLSRIIKRDLRCGINASTINKAFPKLIPEYPYMRCSLLSKVDTTNWPWSEGAASQVKMDGMFCNVTLASPHDLVLQSRQGTVLPQDQLTDLVMHIQTFLEPGYQYHGELLVLQNGVVLPREIGNGIMNSVAKGGALPENHSVMLVCWDMVEIDIIEGHKTCTVTYKERFKRLESLHKHEGVFQIVETRIVRSLEQAYQHYQEMLSKGCEGTILKHPNMVWRDNTSREQLKLKLEVDVDLRIVGFNPGKGRFADTFGSIAMATEDGLLQVDVSGIPDDLRLYAHLNRDKLLETIGTVRANDITKSTPASLYLPRLVEFRCDKDIADSLQEVIEQFENAKAGK